jgi:hypothetical protein
MIAGVINRKRDKTHDQEYPELWKTSFLDNRIGTRPVTLHLSNMDLISKVSDASIRQEIIDLLQQGDVKMILSGLDGDARVQFVLADDYAGNEYSQGFYHDEAGTPDFSMMGRTIEMYIIRFSDMKN